MTPFTQIEYALVLDTAQSFLPAQDFAFLSFSRLATFRDSYQRVITTLVNEPFEAYYPTKCSYEEFEAGRDRIMRKRVDTINKYGVLVRRLNHRMDFECRITQECGYLVPTYLLGRMYCAEHMYGYRMDCTPTGPEFECGSIGDAEIASIMLSSNNEHRLIKYGGKTYAEVMCTTLNREFETCLEDMWSPRDVLDVMKELGSKVSWYAKWADEEMSLEMVEVEANIAALLANNTYQGGM